MISLHFLDSIGIEATFVYYLCISLAYPQVLGSFYHSQDLPNTSMNLS